MPQPTRRSNWLLILGLGIVTIAIAFYLYSEPPELNPLTDKTNAPIHKVMFETTGANTERFNLAEMHWEPLLATFQSTTIEPQPAKWLSAGRIGFMLANGRIISADIYDTQSSKGAFRIGDTYYRYAGELPDFASMKMGASSTD